MVTRRSFLSQASSAIALAGLGMAGVGVEGCSNEPSFIYTVAPKNIAIAGLNNINVANIESLQPDDQLAFTALQGLANKYRPQVYLTGILGSSVRADEEWLVNAVPFKAEQLSVDQLLKLYTKVANGLVVWDPKLPVHTQNLATTLAGVQGLIPVSPKLSAKLTRAPYNLQVHIDLRTKHFTGNQTAYRWALSRMKAGTLYVPGPLSWIGNIRSDNTSTDPALRDWIVAKQGFAFEDYPDNELKFLTTILNAFPTEPVVFGYLFYDDALYKKTGLALDEFISVNAISADNKALIASDSATNLTVHSSFAERQQKIPWDDTPHQPKPGITYITFCVSDGDNVGYDLQRLRVSWWDDPLRGSIPMGFSISAWLPVLAPLVYQYYVKTMSAQETLIAGPSGAGYAYPSAMPDLTSYLKRTKYLMSLAGLGGVWILDNKDMRSPSLATVKQYIDLLSPSVILTDYSGIPGPGANPPAISLLKGVPVAHATWASSVAGGVIGIHATVAGQPPIGAGGNHFVFCAMNTWSTSYADAHQIMAKLGPGFEAVLLDQFCGLVKAALG